MVRYVMVAWAVVAALVVAGYAASTVSSGLLLTNFASATYNLPSGSGVTETDPGVDLGNNPNSASAYVLATDAQQLCLKLWKVALSNYKGAPLAAAGVYPGDMLCFQIGFSNCGAFSGFSVTITDVLPANVVRTNNYPGGGWYPGGNPTSLWSSSLNGPWVSFGPPTGQVAPLYMRWLLGPLGMKRTGYVRYCVTVL